MNVPVEAVEAVARRNYEAEWGDGWEGVIDQIKRGWLNEARAQCEAAAPYMLADLAKSLVQGMEAWAGDKEVGFLEGIIEAAEETNPYRSQA